MLAFELVQDAQSMKPLAKELNAYLQLVDIAYANGLIIYSRRTRNGLEGDHFLVCPPMIITKEQIGEILDMLTKSLDQFADLNKLPVNKAK